MNFTDRERIFLDWLEAEQEALQKKMDNAVFCWDAHKAAGEKELTKAYWQRVTICAQADTMLRAVQTKYKEITQTADSEHAKLPIELFTTAELCGELVNRIAQIDDSQATTLQGFLNRFIAAEHLAEVSAIVRDEMD